MKTRIKQPSLPTYRGELGVLGAEGVEADDDGVAGVDLQVLLGHEGGLAHGLLLHHPHHPSQRPRLVVRDDGRRVVQPRRGLDFLQLLGQRRHQPLPQVLGLRVRQGRQRAIAVAVLLVCGMGKEERRKEVEMSI